MRVRINTGVHNARANPLIPPSSALLLDSMTQWRPINLALIPQSASVADHAPRQQGIYISLGNLPKLERYTTEPPQTVSATQPEDDGFQLYLTPKLLQQARAELFPNQDVEWMLPFTPQVDLLLYQLVNALKNSLEISDTSSKGYVEVIANTLAVHLITRYAVHIPKTPQPLGKLSDKQLAKVTDYIQAHLAQEISLGELAKLACLSACRFAHLFKQSTGLAPHQYHLRCRVERAKQLLQTGGMTIVDIAHTVGFGSQSHFYHHFKHWVGVTPKAFLQGKTARLWKN